MKARQVLWLSWPLRLVTDRTINQCFSGGAWYGRESGSRASKYWHLLHFVATISAPLTEPLKNDHKIPNNNKTRRADKINVFSILLISNILSICVGGSGGKPQKSPQWKQIVPAGVESAKGKMQNTQENTTATTTKEAAHREEEKKGKERKHSGDWQSLFDWEEAKRLANVINKASQRFWWHLNWQPHEWAQKARSLQCICGIHTHTDTHTSLYASVAHINHVLVRQQAGSQAGSKSVRQLARQAAVPTNKAAKTQVGKCSS